MLSKRIDLQGLGLLTRLVVTVASSSRIAIIMVALLLVWETGAQALADRSSGYTLYRVLVVLSMFVFGRVTVVIVSDLLACIDDVGRLFEGGSRSYRKWESRTLSEALTFRSRSSIGLAFLLASSTIVAAYVPPHGFRADWTYLIHIMPLWVVFPIPLVGANVMKGVVTSLVELVAVGSDMVHTTPFDPSLQRIEARYGKMIGVAAIGYLWFPIMAVISPYGFGVRTQLLLGVIGLIPLAALGTATWCLSSLRRRMRSDLLADLGKILVTLRTKVLLDVSKEPVETLQAVLSTIDVVSKYSVVPFSVGGALGVFLSSAAAIYQLAELFLRLRAP